MSVSLPYGVAPPDYRLPEPTHIGRVKLQVSDLERSLAYYQEVLGFRLIDRRATHATLGPFDSDVTLLELQEKKGARTVPHRGLLGLFHFAILLPNRAALGRFLGHLADLEIQPGMSDHLVSEAIYLQDPDNLGIEVYADRPRAEWKHAAKQLTMATMPLDVQGVLAAGGEEPWVGMPAGTTIGHMHLHVGDLAGADTFYHRALGLDKIVWSYPGALFLSAGGYHHHLGTNIWARGAPSASDVDARLTEWELVLPATSDLDQAAASLAKATQITRETHDVVVKDPWGTQLRLKSS